MENIAQIANIFNIVVFFIFGSLIGSFSNVVIFRMVTGVSIVFPPSSCPKCGHRLGFFDLFPIFSWIFLRGKCRYCHEPISIQYPLVETTISLLIGLTFVKYRTTLAFIALSSAFTIWFISSVIFLRNEVKTPNPFLWALVYIAALFWLCDMSKGINANQIIGMLVFSSAIACVVSNSKENPDTISFLTLSFIGMFALSAYGYTFVHYGFAALMAAILTRSEKSRRSGRIAFFILQLVTMAFIV